ncbi:hypothetical protein IDJ75_13815 [Mucilaginibacter rigui]|uniref:Lipoprotein n=1 Tax=Mucilaginibacter rigui TaxID=534635 RepID=A0ABR7X767_9SPHI|nr:hypothetical protein [Mucilaginibacter rigui]MBD1386356.1 hypothetical protein [Mucilaginibacter rigui]
MIKSRLAFTLLFFFIACAKPEIKILDIGAFTINVPDEWQSDVPADQEDSLTGHIKGKNLSLYFDFSTMGYANHLSDLEHESQNIKIDSSGEYIIKTTWPKIAGKGITGIYMQSRKSSLNFQINGRDLSKEHQEQALTAFKTIKIKVKGSSSPLPF